MGSDTDDEVDALYQVPLGEFTAARNALAKARGAEGAEIKALEKPTLSAWAVNQLYWRERATYDAMVTAAIAMRQAHVQVISGHSADVAAAEAKHASTRREASHAARRLIEATGEKATPATIDAIAETLQALPAPDTVPGRLTKPLKPLSFSALMALGIPIQPARRSLGEGGSAVRSPQSAVHSPQAAVRSSQSKKERADRAAARRAAERALKSAAAAEAKAEAVLDAAKKVAADAERELARVRDQVLFLEKQRNDADGVVLKRERDVLDATNTRIQAAQALDSLPE